MLQNIDDLIINIVNDQAIFISKSPPTVYLKDIAKYQAIIKVIDSDSVLKMIFDNQGLKLTDMKIMIGSINIVPVTWTTVSQIILFGTNTVLEITRTFTSDKELVCKIKIIEASSDVLSSFKEISDISELVLSISSNIKSVEKNSFGSYGKLKIGRISSPKIEYNGNKLKITKKSESIPFEFTGVGNIDITGDDIEFSGNSNQYILTSAFINKGNGIFNSGNYNLVSLSCYGAAMTFAGTSYMVNQLSLSSATISQVDGAQITFSAQKYDTNSDAWS